MNMKLAFKNIILKNISNLIQILLETKFGRIVASLIISESFNKNKIVEYNNIKMIFTIPNNKSLFRVNTFSTKEPETLDWIDSLSNDCIIWDIGANIGLYSIYAAKIKNKSKIFAFEPSVFNLELLARNIYLNKLEDRIVIIPTPINENTLINKMYMSNTDWGGAMSTFGNDLGWDGNPINKSFVYNTLSISLDDMINKFNLQLPNYIKMDVDGIEHLLLKSGEKVMNNVDSIIIEINDDFIEQKINAERLLEKYGFKLASKLHSERYNESKRFKNSYNQVWEKIIDK